MFPLLAYFYISGSALRITVNNSIFREERGKSKGAENIRNISLLVGYKQGSASLIQILHKSKQFPHIFSLFSLARLVFFNREASKDSGLFLKQLVDMVCFLFEQC